MARSRKMDPEEALIAAISVFWKHGYAAVGTRQIEDEAGITRFTLQTTYGGKLALFLMALDRYLDMFEGFAPPTDPDTLDSVADWFQFLVNPPMMEDCMAHGCLLLNALIEFGDTEPEVNKRAARYFGMMGGRFAQGLQRLVEKQVLPPEFDVAHAAALLQNAALGMNVLIRAENSSEAARTTAEAYRAMIQCWGQTRQD